MLVSRSDRGLIAQWWFTADRMLLSAVFLLMAIGILTSMAASPPVAARLGLPPFHFFKSQLIYLMPAIAIMIGVSLCNLRQACRLSILIFLLALALMGAAILVGPEIKGSHRWLSIGPFNLQPSELAKPCFVVAVSWFMAENAKRRDVPGLFFACLFTSVFLSLLVIQPDFGQTALVVLTFGSMLLVYGVAWIAIFVLAILGSAGLLSAYLLVPHVASRIDRFLNPDKGDTFQVDTARQAFESGGLLGTGPGGGVAKQILPDAHTDFTFSVIGEEFGLLAGLALIGLFAFIVMRILRRASHESDPFAALSMSGLVIMLGLQAVINMAVNVTLLPAKGMTLPFISYGGSSLVGMGLGMGFILALGRKRVQASHFDHQKVRFV